MAITTQMRTDVSGLYVALFGRAPDSEGLGYWVQQLDQGKTLEQVADAMYGTAPARTYYPAYLTNQEIIGNFYVNVLGRPADPEGSAYWTGKLNEPGATPGSVIAELVSVVANYTGTDPAGLQSAALFNNKVQVAQWYGEKNGDIPGAMTILSGVTEDPATVEAAKTGGVQPGETFTLTEDTAAGADVMRLTGDQAVRIDLTANDNQVKGLDLDADGTIENNGVENNNPTALDNGKDFEIVDAYSRDKLNQGNTQANFLGNISFDGTGFAGDGVNTDGNIFLGGLGADVALGGIGNDFLAGGGVAQTNSGSDRLDGGRNADFFFAELSLLDNTDGNGLQVNGGSTSDDAAVGNNTPQDADWLLLEASDDEDGTVVNLADGADADGLDENDQSVTTGAGQTMTMTEVENVDASGNLYGFLNDFAGSDLVLGNAGGVNSNGEYQGIGSSAQLNIIGSVANNILIGGYDNDRIEGRDGNDLLMGGNLNYSMFNVNAAGIVNNGMDELIGGAGADDIVFEADGGVIQGAIEIDVDDGEIDTLWLTRESLGLQTADQLLADGVLRFDLAVGKEGGIDNAAGYGGADAGGTDADFTADQTNYVSEASRVQVQDMENVIATGLGAIDYRAAGSNDPDLVFNNQQNHFAYNGDLDLRGMEGANTLYAAAGNDVLEGRTGDDLLSGGEGNDDFLFDLENGDDLDVIHRQTDIGNNLTDGTFGRDFGLGGASTTGPSTLSVDFSAANLADANVFMESFSVSIGGETFAVTDAAALAGVTTVAELAALANAAFQAIDPAVTVTASGNTLTITDATVGGGRDISDVPAEGYDVSIKVIAPGTGTLGLPVYTAPGTAVAEDRLLFVSYQDRLDNERVDDDAVFGGDSLGADAYAQDLVVSFDRDGSTVLAEDQQFRVTLTNLAVQDDVTVTVNGVQYSLTVGRALNGDLIPNETTEAFALRLAGYINDFLDDDTAAGKVAAAFDSAPAGTNAASIILTQAAYAGEETVFMQVEVDVDDNSSLGEGASATVTNESQTDITLFQFDGRNGELNADNVLFLGDSGNSRAVLATAADAGGNLFGSDAIVVNVTADDDVVSSAAEGLNGAAIVFNDAENPTTGETANFAIHGDDQLFGAAGNDTIRAGTGDDRVYGSLGLDTIDGGKDLYLVDGVIRVLNRYEAAQVDALPTTLDLHLLGDTDGDGSNQDQGLNAEQNAAFDDTLMLQQADIGAGATFEVTLDLSADQANGGAGKVVVNGNEVANRTLFTNFENIRTVSGNGTLAGQGNDTLDLSVSANPLTGVETANGFDMLYRLDSSVNAGEVYLDRNDNSAWAADELVIAVDGVEHVKFGSGDDVLIIDETEAGKNNLIDGGLGDDLVDYSFDVNGDNTFNPGVTLTVNGGGANVDYVDMAGGSLKAGDVPRDTLTSIETINFNDTLDNPALNDVLDVTNVVDAVVDFVNGEVRDGNGNVQVTIGNMVDFEVVNADYSDTVIVADSMANSRVSTDDEAVQFDSFLNYDRLDGTERQSIADLRSAGAVLPLAENIGLYTFNMGPDADTVDYSNETGLVAAVVAFNGTTSAVSNVLVSDDDNADFTDGSNRIDALTGTENIVASQGESVIDLTNSGMDLKIRFNADDGPVSSDVALDRDTYRIQLSELNSTAPVTGVNFIEYFDAGDSALLNQATAAWNTIEGSDFDEMVELTDHETLEDHTFNLRGGANEVNYNELTRSIAVTIDVVGYNALSAATTGLITAGVTFTNGNGTEIGGQDEITSYSAQNGIAAGSLRIEASQDAEDSVTFAAGLEKLFILGEVVDGSDQITVTVGEAGAQNSLVLTGFEVLLDADSDDVYDMADLDRVVNNLTLLDNLTDDRDTIVVGNDAVGYQAAPADTISLEVLNDEFEFDFDVLDITGVTATGLTVVADTVAARDITGDNNDADDVVVGSIDLLDEVAGFEDIWLTNASIASAGSVYELDLDAGELISNNVTNLITDATGLNFSLVTTAVEVSVTDVGAVGATVVGTAQADTITGGAGADTIEGGAGDDTLAGGFVPEVQEVQTVVITGGFGVDGSNDGTIQIGGITLTEAAAAVAGVSVLDGSDADTIGAAFAAIDTATWETALTLGAGDLDGVSYDALNNVLSFTFATGVDAVDGSVLTASVGYTANTDTGAINLGAGTDVAYAAEADSVDTFVFGLDAVGGVDTITDFDSTVNALNISLVDDLLDFTALDITGGYSGPETEALVDGDSMAASSWSFFYDSVDQTATIYADVNGDGAYNQADDVTVVLTGLDNMLVAAVLV